MWIPYVLNECYELASEGVRDNCQLGLRVAAFKGRTCAQNRWHDSCSWLPCKISSKLQNPRVGGCMMKRCLGLVNANQCSLTNLAVQSLRIALSIFIFFLPIHTLTHFLGWHFYIILKMSILIKVSQNTLDSSLCCYPYWDLTGWCSRPSEYNKQRRA